MQQLRPISGAGSGEAPSIADCVASAMLWGNAVYLFFAHSGVEYDGHILGVLWPPDHRSLLGAY